MATYLSLKARDKGVKRSLFAIVADAVESDFIQAKFQYPRKGVNVVRNLLESRIGKDVDVQCFGGSLSGKVARIEGNILVLEKDERTCFVDIEKIVALWDKPEKKAKSPGFMPQAE